MQQHRGPVIGRDGEVREVVEALCAGGASARVLLVTGEAGAGKSAVLEEARYVAGQEGARVLRLGWEGAEGTADVTLVVDPVRGPVVRDLEDCPLRLPASRRAQLRTAEHHGGVATLSALSEALTEASRQAPYALVVDGVERMPQSIAESLGLLLRIFRPRGVPVVMAGRPGLTAHAGGSPLTAAADRVLELPPLQPADVAALVAARVAERFGRPAEPAVADAVSRALGTLQGNPRAVLSVLGSLDESGLLELDGRLSLTVPERGLRLTTEPAELIRFGWPDTTPSPETVEAAIVTARVLDHVEVRFEDVLRLTPSADARAVEGKLDRLVGDRVLTVDLDGRLSFAVPALAAALRTLPTWRDVPGVYARLVAPVTRRLGAEATGSGYPRLADHVAAAGRRLDDGLAVPLLLAAAREEARADWPLSVRAYAAALRRLAPRDRRTPGVLHEASSLSLRHGDHSGLLAIGEPLLGCLAAPHVENPDGLETMAGAWVLAALHEHRSPYAEDADPRYGKALERLPAAAGLAELGGLYGIGPVLPRPGAGARTGPSTAPGTASATGSSTDPDTASTTDPHTTSGADPGTAPGTTRDTASVTDPGTTSGTIRDTASDTAPDTELGSAPATDPGTTRDTAPDTTRDAASVTDPGTTSDTQPNIAPGAAPGTPADTAPSSDPERCSAGPLPSPAEVRLMAAAVGGDAELWRARQALPGDALDERALERLRGAAAHGDLAAAFAAVLGERYIAVGDSTATRYRGMVRDYLTGDWDAALATARRIEVRSRSDATAGAAQLARALAAEIHCMRGDVVRARAWLERIPDSFTHPLVTRAALGVRYWSGRVEEALEGAWHDVRQARKSGLLAGVERVLLRILSLAALEDRPQTVRRALEELEALHEEVAAPMTHEAVLIGRGMAHHDAESALTAYRMLNRREDVHLRVVCCQCLTEVADDPRPWLAEAARDAHRLGMGRPVRTGLMRAAQRRNVSLPRLRAARETLTELDVELVRMVSAGATNRQIAVSLACSEKTVEQRLTRLFRRTGCRSRAELAAAWLDGNLSRLRHDPPDRP
ncbi:AAA family ATPase [Streptomyces sp. NPDC096132]|uniref:helix-turn-helix transcriptional regulator n=1 Tax=Streptomyces sp. NPDC096132 TaxID=3366075 RepID=UPI00382CC0A7